MKHTEIDQIPTERALEFGTVELDSTPVLGETFWTNVECDSGGGTDKAYGALGGLAPLLLYLIKELLEVLDCLLCLDIHLPCLP
jgi:hypothetical protein